jgi:hypothetical protein
MDKDCLCGFSVLALFVVVFSFTPWGFSKWVVVVSGVLILIKSLVYLVKNGCSCKDGSCVGKNVVYKNSKVKDVSITGDPTAKMPSKDEIKKAMSQPVKKKAVKKKAN